MTRQIDLAGASGVLYRYTPIEENRFLPPAGANYVIAELTPEGATVVYAGGTNVDLQLWPTAGADDECPGDGLPRGGDFVGHPGNYLRQHFVEARPGLEAEDIAGRRPYEIARRGLGFVPEERLVSLLRQRSQGRGPAGG